MGNPNSSNLTGVAFADTLPDGLVVANPPTISGFSCTGSGVPAPTMTGTITANAGTNTISLNGGSITNVAPASCTFSVRVQGKYPGTYTNTSNRIKADYAGVNTSGGANVGYGQANLTVVSSPTVSKGFADNTITTTSPTNTTKLSFTFSNPNSSSISNVNLSDTLPSGLVVANPNGLTAITCSSGSFSGGTLSAVPSFASITLTGATTMAANSVCSFSVNIEGTTTGLKTNTVTLTSPVGNDTATAQINVVAAVVDIRMSKEVGLSSTIDGSWSSNQSVTTGAPLYYRFVVENIGDVDFTSVAIYDTTLAGWLGISPTTNPIPCTWYKLDPADTTPPYSYIPATGLPAASATADPIAYCVVGPVSAQAGTHSNTAKATGTYTSGTKDSANDTATYTATAPDLALAKSNGVASVAAGGMTTYSLTVSNNGDASTSGTIRILDVLPTGLNITDGSVLLGGAQAANWSCSATSNVITCDSSSAIAASGTSVFSFTVNVASNATGPLVNKAKVGGGGDPTNSSLPDSTSTNACSATGTPEGCALDSDLVSSLTIDKDTSTPNAVAGGTAIYSILVANKGGNSLTGVDINDSLPGGFTYASTSSILGTNATRTSTSDPTPGSAAPIWGTWTIDPGGSVVITFIVDIDSGVSAGTYDNTASVVSTQIPGPTDDDGAVANDPGTPDYSKVPMPDPSADPETDEDVTVALAVPGLTLNKTSVLDMTVVAPNGAANAGDTITYGFEATNTGNVPLTNVTVSDSLLGSLSCNTLSLAVGATTSFTCTNNVYTLLQADINNGSRANTADVSSTQTCTGAADCTDTETVTLTAVPGLTLNKTSVLDMTVVAPNGAANAGDTITYGFEATNTGNVPLTNVTVSDSLLGSLSCNTLSLAVGATTSFTCTNNVYTLLQADINNGSRANTADVSSTQTCTGAADCTDTETVTLTAVPGLTLNKTSVLDMTVVAPNGAANAGDTITYGFEATNTGNVPLTNVTVSDSLLGSLSCNTLSLAVGATTSFTCTNNVYTLLQADINNGSRANTADVSSTQTCTGAADCTDTETVTLTAVPGLTLVKSTNGQDATARRVRTWRRGAR